MQGTSAHSVNHSPNANDIRVELPRIRLRWDTPAQPTTGRGGDGEERPHTHARTVPYPARFPLAAGCAESVSVVCSTLVSGGDCGLSRFSPACTISSAMNVSLSKEMSEDCRISVAVCCARDAGLKPDSTLDAFNAIKFGNVSLIAG